MDLIIFNAVVSMCAGAILTTPSGPISDTQGCQARKTACIEQNKAWQLSEEDRCRKLFKLDMTDKKNSPDDKEFKKQSKEQSDCSMAVALAHKEWPQVLSECK